MKNIKKFLQIMAIVAGLLMVMLFAKEASAEETVVTESTTETYDYVVLGIVTDVSADLVEVNIMNGIFTFYGDDWSKGDFVILSMSDKGTPAITDDEILNVQYEGSLQWITTGSKGFGIANLDEKGICGYDFYRWN